MVANSGQLKESMSLAHGKSAAGQPRVACDAIDVKLQRSSSHSSLPDISSKGRSPPATLVAAYAPRVPPAARSRIARRADPASEARGSYTPFCGEQCGNSCSVPGAVLFLDVDGVLHPSHCRFPRQQFKSSCMQLLHEIIQASGAELVLSTAWRLDEEARSILSQRLKQYGLPAFVGRTANIDTFHRSREILAWVRKYNPSSWVAVDDWPLAQETDQMTGRFVQTRPRYGLLPDTADQILALFREQGHICRSRSSV